MRKSFLADSVAQRGRIPPVFPKFKKNKKMIIFEAKQGIFGDYGWKQIRFFRYLWMVGEYNCRIRFTWKGKEYLIGKYAKEK
jgi:hypothetical protein